MAHGSGPNHGKSTKATKKATRARSRARLPDKKRRAVLKSSHGKWTWEELSARNRKLSAEALNRRHRRKERTDG